MALRQQLKGNFANKSDFCIQSLTCHLSFCIDLRLVVPETHVGGKLYELYKQYNEELYMDRIRPAAVVTGHTDLIDVQIEASDLVPDGEG